MVLYRMRSGRATRERPRKKIKDDQPRATERIAELRLRAKRRMQRQRRLRAVAQQELVQQRLRRQLKQQRHLQLSNPIIH